MRKHSRTFSYRTLALAVLLPAIMALPLTTGCSEKKKGETKRRVKAPNVAGAFYPRDREELKKSVDRYVSEAKVEKLGKVRAIIVPHAGYIYSGPTAGYAYAAVRGTQFNTAFVIGPSHHEPFDGISIPDCDAVRTPLGEIPMSPRSSAMKKSGIFKTRSKAHAKEHSVEVHYPFLQTVLEDFTVLPMVTGHVDAEKAANKILKHIDDKTLIVASSDFSHYLDYRTANKLDKATVDTVLDMNTDKLELPNYQACGKTPILILLEIAKAKGWEPRLLDMRNSGDTAGDKSSVVGYASIVFVQGEKKGKEPPEEKEAEIGPEEGRYLVELARKSLEHYYKTGETLKVNEKEVPAPCRLIRSSFVTLTKGGRLRGCIGNLVAEEKLYKNVIDNAVSAATRDTRFQRVKKEELDDIHVEVSVLTQPKKLKYANSEELLEKLRPKVDGVILTVFDSYRATYLPQVWEQIPDKKLFMESLTRKASPRLKPDAWKSKYAKVFVYQALVFEEEKEEEDEEHEEEED